MSAHNETQKKYHRKRYIRIRIYSFQGGVAICGVFPLRGITITALERSAMASSRKVNCYASISYMWSSEDYLAQGATGQVLIGYDKVC